MKTMYSTPRLRGLLAVTTLLFCGTAAAAIQLLDRVVAVVDNDVVMLSELNQRTAMITAQLEANDTPMPPKDVLRSQILEQLISESLQLQIGARVGVEITPEQLDATISRMQSANNLTPEQFRQQLLSEGLSVDMLREQLRREMIIDQVQKGSVNRRINVSQREIDNFLASKQGRFWSSPDYNLGHILIAVSAASSKEEIAAAENKAEEIHQRLVNGADFRQLAVAESQGQDALQGGDLGWRKYAQMPELFAEAVENLPEGGITQPLRSGAGFHILKLYGKRGDQEKVIEQSKVRHILIKPSAILSDDEAREKLARIREQVIGGADFGELARQHSEDVGSMLAGGDLGWSLPGKFVPEFERTINATAVGEVSEPFRSQFGWHILQVEDRRQQDMSEQVRNNQAAMLLRSRRFDEERINWLQEIRGEAFVEIKDQGN